MCEETSNQSPIRIGILGFGHLGKFLYEHLKESRQKQSQDPEFELIFLWNRTKEAFSEYEEKIDPNLIVSTIEEGLDRSPSLIIEVAHPDIICKYADAILNVSDLFIGSPTALADAQIESFLRKKTIDSKRCIYIGTGAFWGAEDVAKMEVAKTLRSLKVTMKKHPDSFRLNEPLDSRLKSYKNSGEGEFVIYSGPVRDLCPLAPNNVNTMAIGAILASHLGFDGVQCCLVADPALTDRHVVEIELVGPTTILPGQEPIDFHVKTVRTNPAVVGAVTGKATFISFLSSVYQAKGRKPGIHVV